MRIEVAGAGAGKTTNLAKKIIKKHNEISSPQNIYCLSYTNKSANKILNMLEKHYVSIPNNIIVSTIHSFLNKELIKPFHHLLYEEHYPDVSNSSLPSNHRYKNSKLKDLRIRGYLHVDEFTTYAKFVVCGKSTDRKPVKRKREKLKNALSTYMGAIFVDEAQDIDENTKNILTEFHKMNIDIELIGDTKQDLKGYGQLKDMVKEYPENVVYNTNCYRCPQVHLLFSNRFVASSQRQENKEILHGEINYVFQSEIDDINKFCEKYELKYIYQKNHDFDTHQSSNNDLIYEELKYIVDKYDTGNESKNFLLKMASKKTRSLYQFINSGYTIQKAINRLYPYGTIEGKDFKKLEEAIIHSLSKGEEDVIKVSSIQSIKGLEAERCLFIITPQLIPYLKNTGQALKMRSHWYVSLTRARNQLTMMITRDVEEKYTKEEIIKLFSKYEINKLEL